MTSSQRLILGTGALMVFLLWRQVAGLTDNLGILPRLYWGLPQSRLIPGNSYVYSLANVRGVGFGPYASFYALTQETFFSVRPGNVAWHLVTPQEINIWHLSNTTIKWAGPQSNRKAIDPKTGIALARRMLGRTFLYDLTRCNCRHYTDYLVYGKTFGRPLDLSYRPMRDDCPLFGPLTSETDVNSHSFKLYDKLGNAYDLGPPDTDSRTDYNALSLYLLRQIL